MSYRIAAALVMLPGAVLAQDDPRTVGVSVNGAVVEVPVEVAARACGIDAETLLAEWEQLDTEMSTMAGTSVAADATDLAPGAAAGTPMGSSTEGGAGADRTDATHEADIDPPVDADAAGADVASGDAAPAGAGSTGSVVGEAASPDAAIGGDLAAAGAGQEASDGPAAVTGDASLAKAAVCEVSAETAAQAGIPAPN